MVSGIRVIGGWTAFVRGYRQTAYVPDVLFEDTVASRGIAQVTTKSMLPVAASRTLRSRSLATGAMGVPIFVRFTPSTNSAGEAPFHSRKKRKRNSESSIRMLL
jgi:hypothetical protein